jgi:DNA helicase HerA-like ATPase
MRSDMNRKSVGRVIQGSLTDGLKVRLDATINPESIRAGKFVCIPGDHYTFFALITDVQLEVAYKDVALAPPVHTSKLLRQVLSQRDVCAYISLKLLTMLDKENNRMPVKTVPAHFTHVFEAEKQDIAAIFGSADEAGKNFSVGNPLDIDAPVCIDLNKFTERSNGVFGKTGTGKTFVTRVLLAGLIKSKSAVNLVFDMHSEYGVQARREGEGVQFVKGLKALFPDKVAIFSLDPMSTRRRGCSPDAAVTIGLDEIRVEDVMPLADELALHPTALEAAYLLVNKYKKEWLGVLLAHEHKIKELAEDVGAHPESLGALVRKLKRVERFSFVTHKQESSVLKELIECLDRGVSVILEFGNHTSMLAYLLVSGMITRRIHEHYVSRTERYLASQRREDEPHKLMITIEEAHKFLNPQAAKQTIFGTIAREMRKYYVSLLVVDQRPSGIDSEVLSQIGTKLIAQLSDDRDIQAVLTGTGGGSGMRAVLATLDTKKQVLVMGHAISMPVVIRTRTYDEQFYRDMESGQGGNLSPEQAISEVF